MDKDAYYFPHDSNSRNDERCLFIRSKYGCEGYGLYWMFIECMHEQTDGKLTCALLDGLAFSYNVDITLLKQFYNDAITVELFVTDGVKYWSERVLRNKTELDKKRKSKSEAGKLGMQSRWGKDNTVITEPITNDNTVITKHNKGKESKVNKKDIYSDFFENVWLLYPRKEGKGSVSATQKEKLHNIGIEEITRAIERYKDKLKKDGTESKYIKQGSTFFNSGYIDYLDKNFKEDSTPEPPDHYRRVD